MCRRTKEVGDREVHANAPDRNDQFVKNRVRNTKYTWWSFIPLNLFEQFKRHINRYFLLIACLQLIPSITPVNPVTTWAPLIIIFGITAIKELADDLGRRKSDRETNSRQVTVIRHGKRLQTVSEDISVGDIVELRENDEVPCDLVLLNSSDEQGNAFIQTTNLDGESNLKSRVAIEATRGYRSPREIGEFKGRIVCAAPNEHIYKFDSQLFLPESGRPISLSADQLLLQATHLRNTEWIYGIAVYTGNETKFGMNKSIPGLKETNTDKLINKFSLIIFLFQLFLVILFGVIGDVWKAEEGTKYEALQYPADSEWWDFIIIPLRFLLLNSTMIPISLKVTLDLCKLFYAKFINNDLELYDPESKQAAHSNSTALSEDLGQVEYILSDKTGTLTENIMELKACSVGGSKYGGNESGGIQDQQLLSKLKQELAANRRDQCALEFCRCMALNNSVVPVVEEGAGGGSNSGIIYKASSPDEEALVQAAANLSISLQSREGPEVKIRADDRIERYTQLHEFEFTSDRKRMSVLVRCHAHAESKTDAVPLRLYCKGADEQIFARLSKDAALNSPDFVSKTVADIEQFAHVGLRTLVLAYRDLSEEEYEAWKLKYEKASAAMKNREEELDEVYKLLEKDLRLLGATAIEDKLQDKVPETIALLREAGIRFWMLTGDKFSTALTIANNCNLRPTGSRLVSVDGASEEEVKEALETQLAALKAEHYFVQGMMPARGKRGKELSKLLLDIRPPVNNPTRTATAELSASQRIRLGSLSTSEPVIGYTLIITGTALHYALQEENIEKLELLCLVARAVVCCRVTPKQKRLLVELVKRAGFLALAIGDGGNDVGMIQEAQVGVGIRGKEGLQAARTADYSVSFFRALQRLVLVHGRWSYYRTALVAQYSFYKSFLFCFLQIAYGFYSGFAGVSLFNSLCVAAYNAVLFVPVVFFFVDRDLEPKTLFKRPEAYHMTMEGTLMNWRSMGIWFLRALYQAIIMIIIAVGCAPSSHESAYYETLGLLVFSGYLLVQSVTMTLELRGVTWYNVISIYGLHVAALFLGWVANVMSMLSGYIDPYSFSHVFTDPVFWLSQFLMLIATVAPVEVFKAYGRSFIPTFGESLGFAEKHGKVIPSTSIGVPASATDTTPVSIPVNRSRADSQSSLLHSIHPSDNGNGLRGGGTMRPLSVESVQEKSSEFLPGVPSPTPLNRVAPPAPRQYTLKNDARV